MSSSTGEKKRKIVKDEVYVYIGQEDVPKTVTDVRCHPSVVDIGMSAFEGCNELREVELNDGLREIGDYAFRYCTALQSINIPSTVTKISYSAFRSCTNLQDVVLNNGLKEICSNAFQDCSSIQSVTISSTVTDIGHSTFNNCTNLREVVLSEGLKKIGIRAFQNCISLERITIPSTVTEINLYAFWNCANLREVVIHDKEIQIGDKSVFGENCTSLERFSFPILSTRLDDIIQAGQRDIEAKMNDIAAVEWRDGELIIPTVRREVEHPWREGTETAIDFDREKLAKIEGLIRYYEMREATSLFELALWRSNMVETDTTNPADRVAYRIEVPGPVKETVLQLLLSRPW